MPLIHMVLADSDFQYISHLSQWFIENKSYQFQVSAFTEKESFLNFLSQKDNEIDIILAEEGFLVEYPNLSDSCVVLGKAIKLTNIQTIEKFRSASSICSDVISIISKKQNDSTKWSMSGKSELVICYSPNLYLKSSIAILITLLTTKHVYVNFESFPFFELDNSYQAYSKNLSDILYHIKAEKGNPLMMLESAIATSSDQIQFIPPVSNPTDIWEISKKEMDIFIEALTTWGHFSRIIVDIECNTSPMIIKLLEASSSIIIPFDKTQKHQIMSLNNILNSILGKYNDKVKWVCCGDCAEKLIDVENYFQFPWLNACSTEFTGFSLDTYKINQLESLFS